MSNLFSLTALFITTLPQSRDVATCHVMSSGLPQPFDAMSYDMSGRHDIGSLGRHVVSRHKQRSGQVL